MASTRNINAQMSRSGDDLSDKGAPLNLGSDRTAGDAGSTAPLSDGFVDSGVGRSYVGTFGSTMLLIVILTTMAIVVYSLVAFWPPPAGVRSPASSLFGVKFTPDRDQQLFIVVGLAGSLGGFLHSARSLYWYIGNRVLRRSWIAMYMTLPVIGGALAIVFCLILRGGLLTGEATGEQINFFGFSAVAALVGLFSPEASEKLKQVFSTVLAPAEPGRDRTPVPHRASIDGVEPSIAPRGSMITIYGANLAGTTSVLFHGARTTPSSVSQVAITAEVPEGASTGQLSLVVENQILTAPEIFHVET